jgi:hypothetical protein
LKKRIRISWLLLAAIFVVMLVLNYWTPLVYDDYRYHLETKGFATIFADEYHQWLTWTGRSVAHVILRFLLRFPKPVFDVVSAGAFTYLVFVVSKLARGTRQLSDLARAGLSLLVFGLIWVFTPEFAQVYFWMSGAANYALVMVIMLSYLLVFHQAVMNPEQSGWLKALGMFLLGILAGWCNENTSGGVVIIAVGYVLLACLYQHQKLQTWMISGLVGNVIGLAVMVSAPGNAIRAAHFPQRNNLSLLWKIIDGMTRTFPSIMTNGKLFMVIALGLLIFTIWQNGMRLQEWISTLFMLGGLATIVVLLVAPAGLYWSRSYFGGIFFIIVSIAISVMNLLDRVDATARLGITALSAYVAVVGAATFLSGISDSYQNHVSYSHQLTALIKQRTAGKQNVVVPTLSYTAQTPYAITDKNDMSTNAKSYRNKQTAAYWKVKSVRSVPNKQVK